ncbi:MAG: DUF4276 family protein [bacterium]
MRILYFLEDRAQEGFIIALVNRIAKEESIAINSLNHDIRSARGGSRVIKQFKKFLRDMMELEAMYVDLLVVAVDGNCQGYQEKVRKLEDNIRLDHPLKNRVVYAVPDPHIERWYIMDQRAFKQRIGLDKAPDLPEYKCKKDYYKQALSQALKDANIGSLLGGVEYAERIVENIDNLDSLGRQNSGFQNFVEQLRRSFRERMRKA